MRCLLLALSVALACGTQDIFVPLTGENLDVQKVTGPWFSMAMVASDVALLSAEDAPLRLYIKELRPTAEGGLEVTMLRWEDGRCLERKVLAEKTGVPASFQIRNTEDSGESLAADVEGGKIHVLDTDYKNYLFLCLEAARASGSGSAEQGLGLACQYLARTPKVEQEVMEQFSRAMKLLPVDTSVIFTPTQAQERCRV